METREYKFIIVQDDGESVHQGWENLKWGKSREQDALLKALNSTDFEMDWDNASDAMKEFYKLQRGIVEKWALHEAYEIEAYLYEQVFKHGESCGFIGWLLLMPEDVDWGDRIFPEQWTPEEKKEKLGTGGVWRFKVESEVNLDSDTYCAIED